MTSKSGYRPLSLPGGLPVHKIAATWSWCMPGCLPVNKITATLVMVHECSHAALKTTLSSRQWLFSQAAEQRSLERVSGFQQSLEAESEGILLVDTSTPDWNILFQNEAWLRVTGMTREEVHGGKLWHLFTPAGQTRVGTPSSLVV